MAIDSQHYIENNPDVKQAIDNGTIKSCTEHWIKHGSKENRKVKWNYNGWPRIPQAVVSAPLLNTPTYKKPWEGSCRIKPWEYKITAIIPTIESYEMLQLAINILRLQTERPYIIVIDTGSTHELDKIIKLQAEDLEVHTIRLNGVVHPSDFPAMAMDLAFTLCRTEYLFCTHVDCFLRKRSLLADMMSLCQQHKAVGYRLSPREHADWQFMVGHTCTMLHMPTMDDIDANWSQRRLCKKHGIQDYSPDPLKPNWPDTELLLNYTLKENNISPLFIGTEENYIRTLDENIDHCRTVVAGMLYSPEYYKKASEWVKDATEQAKIRIQEWTTKLNQNHPC